MVVAVAVESNGEMALGETDGNPYLNSFMGENDFTLQASWQAIVGIGQFQPNTKGTTRRINDSIDNLYLSEILTAYRSLGDHLGTHSNLNGWEKSHREDNLNIQGIDLGKF
jgi:hypothetical protein